MLSLLEENAPGFYLQIPFRQNGLRVTTWEDIPTNHCCERYALATATGEDNLELRAHCLIVRLCSNLHVATFAHAGCASYDSRQVANAMSILAAEAHFGGELFRLLRGDQIVFKTGWFNPESQKGDGTEGVEFLYTKSDQDWLLTPKGAPWALTASKGKDDLEDTFASIMRM